MGAAISRPPRKGQDEQQTVKGPSDTHNGRPADWSLVETCGVEQWKGAKAEVCGFDFPLHWSGRDLRVRKWPWKKNFEVTGACGHRKGKTLSSCSCCVTETGRKEKLGAWVKDVRVVGFHPRVLVVQVVLRKSLKLMVVDWQQDQLLATYSFYYHVEPCYQECVLSPDASLMACRQDFFLKRHLHHVMSFDPNIRILQIKDGLCRRLFVIQDYLAQSLCGSGLSFDPRFPQGRLVVFSSTQQTALNDLPNSIRPNRLRVYDLTSQQVVMAAGSATDRLIHHAGHSPDGRLVAVLGVNRSIHITCHIVLSCVDVYSADTLQRLWRLELKEEPCRMWSLHAYPAFSRNGSLLAVRSGDKSRLVSLYQMPQHGRSLMELCRRTVLHHTPRNLVPELPLPDAILRFLLFMK